MTSNGNNTVILFEEFVRENNNVVSTPQCMYVIFYHACLHVLLFLR